MEVPSFGHSDNHAGLQLADLICSAFLWPMAMHAYCEGHITVIGRFKTSHSWALWKTSHDVMGFVSSTRLYSDDKLGQLA
jgi:hypothetical protein